MSLEMTQSEREAFLSDVHVGVISIPRRSKGPLTLPIWYDYEPGGPVRVITNRTSFKGKLLGRASRLSLCTQTETAPYKYVSIEGPFSTEPTAADSLRHMAIRYLGREQGERYAAASGTGEDSITVSIVPENWYTVDYEKR